MNYEFVIINYGSKTIQYKLSFADRKSLGIKVLPDGLVTVVAPNEANIIEINKKVKSKANWILKQQAFFYSYMPKTQKRKFVSGETHLYLGRQYVIEISQANFNEIKIYRGKMVIIAKKNNPEYLEKRLNEWYKEKATLLFEELVNTALDKFAKYNLQKPTIEIRQMEKRWGSCTKSGKVILNMELIKAPKASIEYVVIHELCHLIHHNHNKAFYELQERIIPDWKKWKEKLEHTLS